MTGGSRTPGIGGWSYAGENGGRTEPGVGRELKLGVGRGGGIAYGEEYLGLT